MLRVPFVGLVITLALTGCGSERALYDRPAGIAGVGSMVNPDAFEEVDLVSLLDPDGHGHYDDADEQKRIAIAFDSFSTYDGFSLETRRNAVQERLLAASNQRCNYFKNLLYASRAGANFGFGSAATAAGAAGAIVTGLASQILAGTAAVFSGVRAEYNQEFFANLATHIVVQGIDLRRRQVYEEIVLHGQAKPYDAYNVQAAVKDAIYYHGQCSTIVGVQVAGDTIKLIDDPGIDTANRILAKLKTTSKLLRTEDLDPGEAIRLVNTTEQLLQAGTPLGEAATQVRDPLDRLASVLGQINETAAAFATALDHQTLTADQKTALTTALERARAHAVDLAQACKDKAADASAALASARLNLKKIELDATAGTGAVVGARFGLQQAETTARDLSTAIGQVQVWLKAYLDAATKLLEARPIDVDAVRQAIDNFSAEQTTSPCA